MAKVGATAAGGAAALTVAQLKVRGVLGLGWIDPLMVVL